MSRVVKFWGEAVVTLWADMSEIAGRQDIVLFLNWNILLPILLVGLT